MTHYVSRTCTEIGKKGSPDESGRPSRPLEDFRETEAYVLLGAPGAGKTEAFKQEAAQCPNGCYVEARDFNTFDDEPEWDDATLFIDGLDEMRAGSTDGRTPLDRIRKKLKSLGCPRFRLSCREADWFGANDRTRLQMVSRNGAVNVLRLDPLSDDDIREILLRNHHIEDADSFIASARERGIDGLLPNPESLRMLVAAVAAVAGGRWPETRIETFELACCTLLKEHSSEHRTAMPDGTAIFRLMDVAGRLCAVQLLAGNAGYTLFANLSRDPRYPGLEQIPGNDRAVLRYTLGTKLFEAPSEGRVAPVHRQVAEFLAARYLARLVADGLPVGRILALMTGHDGVPVSELRGLAAWLAAHSRNSRLEIITRDPLGTILYGDVGGFPTDEKHRLLECLEHEAKQKSWFRDLLESDARLGDIATPDMAPTFREILSDAAQDDAKQSLVRILLLSLKHGPVVPNISDPIVEIVRDDNWATGVRIAAVDVLFRHMDNRESETGALTSLLADIGEGSVSDPDNELLGSLLTGLYPASLSATEVIQYLRTPKHRSLFGGRYYSFWTRQLLLKSTDAQCGEIIDGIAHQFSRLRPLFLDSFGRVVYGPRLLLPLLKRLIESSQEDISPRRLFNWFRIVSDSQIQTSLEKFKFIRNWLNNHPRLLKEIIRLGVEHCADSRNFRQCIQKVELRFLDATLPPNWCLEQALASTDASTANYFIHKVADFVQVQPDNDRLPHAVVEKHLAGKATLMHEFNQRLASFRKIRALATHAQEQSHEYTREREKEWRNHIKPHEINLRENRCHPAYLHHLAEAYFGNYQDVEGETPEERLRGILGDDEELIRAVFDGLRGSINRGDLPSDSEILRLGSRNRQHHLSLPFMAGLEEASRIAPNRDISLDEKQMRLAVAIRYTSGFLIDDNQPPGWFPRLSRSHPNLVAEVLIAFIRSKIKSDSNIIVPLFELAQSPDHEAVARVAVLPLLKMFPARCRTQQLQALYYLLEAALKYCERNPLLKLIDRKLAYRSMNVGQRVHWLVAGCRASPDLYRKQLESYITDNKNKPNERRVRYLAEAVKIEDLEGPPLKLLIQLMGGTYRPHSLGHSESAHTYTRQMQVADDIRRAIHRLAADPSRSASEILESLATDDTLIPWRPYLNYAIDLQNDLRRESSFRHADIEQVIQALDNRRPANAADLAALTTDHLRDISRKIRDGNTSDWKQFWHVDSYNRVQRPRPEDACRDRLLSNLQERLSLLDIDAHPEGRYSDGKRSDIRVSYRTFNVPLEVKRSCHGDLWSAVRRQLIPKYTRDPGANGYGIYLVFWFGNTEHCRATPGEKSPPKSADQLEELLQDTLSDKEKRKIWICVIDVAKPETRSKLRPSG